MDNLNNNCYSSEKGGFVIYNVCFLIMLYLYRTFCNIEELWVKHVLSVFDIFSEFLKAKEHASKY